MRYELWSSGVYLGITERELQSQKQNFHMWKFQPSSAGFVALPRFREILSATQAFAEVVARSIESVPFEKRADHITTLSAETSEGERLRVASAVIQEMMLELRDENGATLNCTSISLSITDQVTDSVPGLSALRQQALEEAGGPPPYILVAQVKIK